MSRNIKLPELVACSAFSAFSHLYISGNTHRCPLPVESRGVEAYPNGSFEMGRQFQTFA